MHNLEILPSAFKYLEQLTKKHKNVADRIAYSLDRLRTEPLMGKKLMGELKGLRSLRVGDYRIIYCVVTRKILIQVIKIGHRREIYT